MSIENFLVLGSVFIAAVASAQTPLGTVGNVQGLVTVTDGATGGAVAPGSAITDGTRFVTTSSGSVTLQLNNGCTVTLQPNQAVTIDRRMTCQQLIAAVESLGGVGLAGGDGGGSFGKGLLAVGGLALAGFSVHRVLDRNPSLSGQ